MLIHDGEFELATVTIDVIYVLFIDNLNTLKTSV